LLYPPFEEFERDSVGYIASYPNGIRENGGQYTHAAAWAVMAMAEAKMNNEAIEVLTAINPASICRTREGAERYRGEPYFVAGDVSGAPDSIGRCGWSLYTGSAGWVFNAIFASILGIVIECDTFTVNPTLSPDLPCYTAIFTHLSSTYEITVHRGEKNRYRLDGKNVNNLFHFDKNYHLLEITVEISSDLE
jgi:cyclic beta-1,2-glucan synthetase